MEYKKTLYLIVCILITVSCNTEIENQETNFTEQENIASKGSLIVGYDTIAALKKKNIFLKGKCEEYRNEDSYDFTEICYYPNALNLTDLYDVFKKEYTFKTKIVPLLPVNDTIIKGEYPMEISYLKTKFNTDTIQINLFFPGGEDYIYLYSQNDSNFISHTYSPD
jgi:hypothetical protein